MIEGLQVIYEKQGKAVTDSLKIAEMFEKEHGHVLRDIENLTIQNWKVKKCFHKDEYTNSRGRTYPKYYMNKDGFSYLALGFTGAKALDFKISIIEEFNRMEEYIKETIETGITTVIPEEYKNLPEVQNILNMANVVNELMAQQIQHLELAEKVDTLEHTITEVKENVDFTSWLNTKSKFNTYLKKLARQRKTTERELRTQLYDKVNEKKSQDLYYFAKKRREEINKERVESGKKPYAESTLSGKYSYYDAIVELGYLETLAGFCKQLEEDYEQSINTLSF